LVRGIRSVNWNIVLAPTGEPISRLVVDFDIPSFSWAQDIWRYLFQQAPDVAQVNVGPAPRNPALGGAAYLVGDIDTPIVPGWI